MTMGELAASIAHEVNQPLGAIVGNADICLNWLANGRPDLDQLREALADISNDGHRASEVIARIRSLVKKSAPQKTMLDLNEVVGEVLALVRHEAQRKQVALNAELHAELPRVHGDRVQLQQVLLNLTMNAIEAMSGVEGRQRQLTVKTVRSDGNEASVAVQDNGVGITPSATEQLFKPFHTTKTEGMGMGLAICRSIIQAHGGYLWAEPNAGPGATFQFTLPPDGEAP
jgi:signal transduction histidine kinase